MFPTPVFLHPSPPFFLPGTAGLVFSILQLLALPVGFGIGCWLVKKMQHDVDRELSQKFPGYRYTVTVKDARTESEKSMAAVHYRGPE